MSKAKFHTVADIPPVDPVFTPAILADLEQKLAAMVDERLASLERRVDLLYRYTVGDKTGWRYPSPPFGRGRGDEFPAPDYDHPGGPTKPPELEG